MFWGRFSGEEPEVQLQNVKELWEYFEQGRLNPVVTDSFPLEHYEQAFNCLIDRKAREKPAGRSKASSSLGSLSGLKFL